jgi:proteasome activator subunit 4
VDESPAARLATTRWIPVITTFVKSKSELAIADLEAVVQIGLDLLLQSSDNLTIQQRWGHCVTRLVCKYHKKLHLEVEWKPFYAMLLSTHFKRRYSYEGLAMRTHHLDCIVALVRCCRRFFPLSSGAEIWFEFR